MRLPTPRFRTTRSPWPPRFYGAALLVLCLFGVAPARAAEGVKVDVVVDGLTAEMKRNVLGSMMLASAAGEGRLSEAEARRLAARAPQEIELALQPFGYYRPTVRAEFDTQADPWKARFAVEAGPALLVSSVDATVTGPGAEFPRFRELIRNFALKPGGRLEHAPYEALKADLNKTAAGNGYLDAKFVTSQITVDLEAYTARVELRFDTGPRYFFGPVRFEQDILDEAFVNSFVTFKTGEPYNVDSLIAMQSALGSSPYFSRVEVEPRRDQATDLVVPIDVRLKPAKRVRYTLGGGYGTDTGFQLEAKLELRQLNKKGHRAELNGMVSQFRNSVGAQYQLPRAFGRKQLLTYSIAALQEETDAQRTSGGSVGVALTRSRGLWQESFGLYFRREDFTVGADRGNPDLLFPEFTWRRVQGDAPIQPRKGTRLVFILRTASDKVGSDITFSQLEVQTKLLHGTGKRGRVIVRAEAGGIRTHDFHALPPTIRYFSGGASSVRAYGYQDLGPHDDTGEPVGGQRLLFGNVELEQRLWGDWGVAEFYDVGNALVHFDDPLAQGAGAGMRWFSPVGMVRLDIAWPLRDSANDFQIQFSIGPDL